MLLMDISSGQTVSQEMSQKHSMHVDIETTIKEVLKLVALSELMQANFHDMCSQCNVSANFCNKSFKLKVHP